MPIFYQLLHIAVKNCEAMNAKRDSDLVGTDMCKQKVAYCGKITLQFLCEICGRRFSEQLNLDIHMGTHAKRKSHKCQVCGKSFPTKEFLDIHVNGKCKRLELGTEEFNPPSNRGQCELLDHMYALEPCGTKHSKRKADRLLSKKRRKVTHNGELVYNCPNCDKRFATQGALNGHRGSHRFDDKYFKCLYCTLRFNTIDDIVSHMNNHKERAQEKSHKCPTCDAEFIADEVLEIHRKKHIPEQKDVPVQNYVELLFKCVTCGREFPDAISLNVHSATHGFDKKFRCKIFCRTTEELALPTQAQHAKECEKTLQREDSTGEVKIMSENAKPEQDETHRLEVSDHDGCKEDKKLTFLCVTCDKSFQNQNGLNAHRRKHKHTRKTLYKCSVCEAEFDDENLLNIHLTKQERPFVCLVCGKEFASQNALRGHGRFHRNEKKHVCPYCPKQFFTLENLTSHMKIYNKGGKKITLKEMDGSKKNISSDTRECQETIDITHVLATNKQPADVQISGDNFTKQTVTAISFKDISEMKRLQPKNCEKN